MSKITRINPDKKPLTGEMVIDSLSQIKSDIEAITVIYSDRDTGDIYLAGNVTHDQFVEMYQHLFGRDYL